jgi:hypothetical protein
METPKITDLEIQLEMNGYLIDELKQSAMFKTKITSENEELKQKQKELVEFILWIKEAFGHCINEDYFSWPLGEHIDFTLVEIGVEIPNEPVEQN